MMSASNLSKRLSSFSSHSSALASNRRWTSNAHGTKYTDRPLRTNSCPNAQEMRFSASGIAEYQDVFAAIEEVAFHQHDELPIHRLLDAIPIKRLECFLPRQFRVGQ